MKSPPKFVCHDCGKKFKSDGKPITVLRYDADGIGFIRIVVCSKCQNEFLIEACRFIARTAGIQKFNGWEPTAGIAGQVVRGNQFVYVDEKMVIFAGAKNMSLEVVIRSGVTPSGIENPAIMVNESGNVFRMHGETKYIKENVAMVVSGIIVKG